MSLKDAFKKYEWFFHTAIFMAVWLFYYLYFPPYWPPIYLEISSLILGILYGFLGIRGLLRSIKNEETNQLLRYSVLMLVSYLILIASLWNSLRH